MAATTEGREIGIVLYPGAQLAAVHGLTDLFALANRFSSERHGGTRLCISHWRPERSGISCVYRSEPFTVPRPEILIIPPTLGDLPDPKTCAAIEYWLLRQHAQGVALVTVCSGIFLVAGTRLLDGRLVSTHRVCAQTLMHRFPDIAVDVGERMIEHPAILTAGGFMAWVDVALLLIERLLGESTRAETAQFVLTGHATRSSTGSAGFTPPFSHHDTAVRRAQELIHLRDGQDVSVALLAAAARLERRTFLRRFTQATGMAPIEYCRAVRIARARELLEAGNMPLKQIAVSLGYGDVISFARAFRRVCGVPPKAYRTTHGGSVVELDTQLSLDPSCT